VNPPDESFLHLFLECPTVRAWHTEFLRLHFNGLNLANDDRKKFWFLGIVPDLINTQFAVLSAVLVFQFSIWEEKLRKRKPAFRTINLLFEDIFNSGFKKKQKIFGIGLFLELRHF
jgi:hypothetical protein